MKFLIPLVSRNRISRNYFLTFLSSVVCLVFLSNVNAQQYPPSTTLSDVSYNPPSPLPGYLEPFTEENFGNKITRISDPGTFGIGDQKQIRHAYSKRQPWNSDGSYIALQGGNPKLLDGNNYTYLATVSGLGNMGWSHTNPLITYATSGASNYFEIRLLDEATLTSSAIFSRTFSQYTVLSHWSDESNISIDDKYVALYGKRASTGNDCWVLVYDIETDTVISETNLQTPFSNIDWVSMSQSGEYVVVGHVQMGTNEHNGVWAFDRYMQNGQHICQTHHADIGYDMFGNEVIVTNGENDITSYRLDGVGEPVVYLQMAISGGHVSFRNYNRPGWAYISDQGNISQNGDYDCFREIFAIKLDERPGGVTTVQRFAKSYANQNMGYDHEAHAVSNPDGTKVMFASNMEDSYLMSLSYPFSWVVETQNGSQTFAVDAGEDQTICDNQNQSVTLTASGAENYVWSTNETGNSITVTPTQTTTYTVTGSDSSGNEAEDSVTVFVNEAPTANAGGDVEICEDNSVSLTATGGGTYQWSTGETTQTIVVTPESTTTYSVTVTQNGCSDSDDIVVTVKPRPMINAGIDVDIYLGESTTLTATGDGTFEWNTGETTESITVSPTATTTYTVTATFDGCSNTDTVTVNVTDSSTVVANAGEDVTICSGESTTLTASGGSTYLWSTGETTQSITVSPNETTNYSVTVYEQSNSDIDEVMVNVNPLPIADAGNDITILHDSYVTLTASGGSEYIWNTGETTQSISVNPSENTTYTVEVIENGCSAFDSVNVIVQVQANAGGDISICEGNTITLEASGGPNYVWSTGETTQSIEVSPNSTATYSVTVFNQTDSDTDDVIVNVNPTPTIDLGEDISIIYGESITLSANAGTEFLWNTGETTQSIEVNPTENATYSVEVFENGCSSTDSIDVIVNVAALVDEDPVICQGESVTLNASGGSNYVWSTGETSQSISVSPSQTSTYSVVVSNSTSSDEANVTVNVNLIPNVNAGEDDIIEAGQNITLTASGGNSYLWSTGETSQSILVSPMDTTTYTVEAFINGCSSIDDVTIEVVDPVAAYAGNDVDTCQGEPVTLTATGGLYFEWSTGDTSPSITVTPNETTIYSVNVSNGISTQTDNVKVTVESCLSVSQDPEYLGFEYTVYPNPSSGLINIRLSGLENISSIYVTDMIGKIIRTESFEPQNGLLINKEYDLSSLAKGIYFVRFVQSGEEPITKKIILQ